VLSIFRSKDRFVYFVCGMAGLGLYFFTKGWVWAPYVATLLTYHLFLVWLLLTTEKKVGLPHNIVATVSGHLLVIVLVIASNFGIAFAYRTFLSSLTLENAFVTFLFSGKLIRVAQAMLMYGLSFGELDLLFINEFNGENAYFGPGTASYAMPKLARGKSDTPLIPATGEDHFEWVQNRSRNGAFGYDPNKPLADDFEEWLRARGKTQYAASGAAEMTPAGD
jgi:hypothetical protein